MSAAGDWTTVMVRLGLAALAGAVIGFEREWRGHDAGLRTHALVALSAATITLSALLLSDQALVRGANSDPVRVVQGLAQAIGFIAGGLIFVRGGDVRNMTTATGLWLSAAIGIAAGAGQFVLLACGTTIALAILLLFSGLERFIPRRDHNTADERPRMPNRRGAIGGD